MTNKEKKTTALCGRETVRMKFTKARKFINPVNYIIQMGYIPRSGQKKKTPIGRAMSTILQEAMVGNYPHIEVDPAKAKLSTGIKGGPAVLALIREKARIKMTWNTDFRSWAGDMYDDRIILCAYAVEQELAAINENEALRNDGQLQMELPDGMDELPVHLYLIVHDREQKAFSNSLYLGLF
ncbi:DUF6266 family protein [Sphingobacterium luzhongxinii]|uniref:DUF6266 family protein n=1 Tax=Sphingobacterium luzhongxinii TaxID=2654181 RepID=UPI0013D9AD36|nr:DUF6266 family protein [Sphingobacterium sp. xlx-73]